MTRNTSSGELGLVFTRKLNSHPTLAFVKSKPAYSRVDPGVVNFCSGTRKQEGGQGEVPEQTPPVSQGTAPTSQRSARTSCPF